MKSISLARSYHVILNLKKIYYEGAIKAIKLHFANAKTRGWLCHFSRAVHETVEE